GLKSIVIPLSSRSVFAADKNGMTFSSSGRAASRSFCFACSSWVSRSWRRCPTSSLNISLYLPIFLPHFGRLDDQDAIIAFPLNHVRAQDATLCLSKRLNRRR